MGSGNGAGSIRYVMPLTITDSEVRNQYALLLSPSTRCEKAKIAFSSSPRSHSLLALSETVSVFSIERVILEECRTDGVALLVDCVKVLTDFVESMVSVGGKDLVVEDPTEMEASVPVMVRSFVLDLVGVTYTKVGVMVAQYLKSPLYTAQ